MHNLIFTSFQSTFFLLIFFSSYTVGILAALGSLSGPPLRSILSKMVAVEDQGMNACVSYKRLPCMACLMPINMVLPSHHGLYVCSKRYIQQYDNV